MKKAVIALVVVFLGFWLVTDPQGLADSAQRAGGRGAEWAGDLFTALIAFLRGLQ